MISLIVLIFFLFQVGCGLGETFEKILPEKGKRSPYGSCETPVVQSSMQQFNSTWNKDFIYAVDVCFQMEYPAELFICDTINFNGTPSWRKTPAKITFTLRLAQDETKFVNLSVNKTIQSTESCVHFDIETISEALQKYSIPRDNVILYGAVTFPENVVTRIKTEEEEKRDRKDLYMNQLRGTGSFLVSEDDFKKRNGDLPYTTIYNFSGSDGKGLEPIFNQTAEKETVHTKVDGRDIKIETFRNSAALPVKGDDTLDIHTRGWGTVVSSTYYFFDQKELKEDIIIDDSNTEEENHIIKDDNNTEEEKDTIKDDRNTEGETTNTLRTGHTTKSVSYYSSIIMILTIMTLTGL